MLPRSAFAALALATLAACTRSSTVSQSTAPAPARVPATSTATSGDPRVGLKPGGERDAGEAIWNARFVGMGYKSQSGDGFSSSTNSDLAFTGKYAVQGNYHGFLIYDISNPATPVLVSSFVCPASQNDVSVYKQQLLFMSAEAPSARLDCGTTGIQDSVSMERVRGIRIFDISDIRNPKYVTSVQTCRGSHTHSVLEDPRDKDNVYIYVSGSSQVRSPREMAECSTGTPDSNPATAMFRVEIIQVPVARPQDARIANRARIFQDLGPAGARHGDAPADIRNAAAALAAAKAGNGFYATFNGREQVLQGQVVNRLLDSIALARGGPAGSRSGADSSALRAALPRMTIAAGGPGGGGGAAGRPTGPNQCHDITLYPEAGIGGGACQGYGILLDIRDPLNPKRITQVTDTTNMTAWHSVTFNNDGTKVLWSDEWGGGGSPKCRADDPKEWGANAIFSIENGNRLKFNSYYKISAAQTEFENCVAHNGSLIPIPDRDVMIQGWYQGGISIFDWTNPSQVKEIAYFDRGPVDTTRRGSGGSWSAYWYNGNMYSSEIARGFDVVELTPSEFVSENELIAAKSVVLPFFNAQGQPKLVWPASFALVCSYLDQLERNKGFAAPRIAAVRSTVQRAELASGDARRTILSGLATELHSEANSAADAPKVHKLATAVGDLANAQNPVGCARRVS